MSDFTKYSNYSNNSGFSSIVFGANAPLLEVELNELQQIILNRFSLLLKAFGSPFIDFSNESGVTNGVLTLKDCIGYSKKGHLVYINELTKTLSVGYCYLKLEEVTVDYTSELKAYGDKTSSVTVQNKIKDDRGYDETSRRKVVNYEVVISTNEILNANDREYILIGYWDGEQFTQSLNRIATLEKQLKGISFGVEDGIVYAEVPEDYEQAWRR